MSRRLNGFIAAAAAAVAAGAMAGSAMGQVALREYGPIPSPTIGQPGEFGARPHDVEAAAGAIWFTQFRDGQIGRLDIASGAITEYNLLPPLPGRSNRPEPREIALQPGTGLLWWSEFSGGRISYINPAAPGTPVSEDVGDTGPNGLAFAPDGSLWVSLRKTNQLLRRAPDGTKTVYNLPTADPNPGFEGVAVGAGKVWVAAIDDGDGNLKGAVYAMDLNANPSAPGSIRYPLNGAPITLSFDPAGNLWTGAITIRSLVRLVPGQLVPENPFDGIDRFPLGTVYPHGVLAGADQVWFADYGNELLLEKQSVGGNGLGVLTPSTNTVTRYTLPASVPTDPKVQRLAFDPAGNVWFTETKGNRIGVLDTGPLDIPGAVPLNPTSSATVTPGAVPLPPGTRFRATLSAKRLRATRGPRPRPFTAKVLLAGKATPVGAARTGRAVKLQVQKRVTLRRRAGGRVRVTRPLRWVDTRRATLNRRTGAFSFRITQPKAARYRVAVLPRPGLKGAVSRAVRVRALVIAR